MKLTMKAPAVTNRVLVYGGPKTGKTELVGKLAEHYNLIWFDAENGYVTLTKMPQAWQERVEMISIPDSRVMPMAVETWLKVIKGTEHFVCEAHGKCSCALCKKQGLPETRVCFNELSPTRDIVVFDSLTQFSNSCISNITKAQPDDYKMDFGDWGQLGVLVDKFLSQVQAARYNVVCITHEAEVDFEDGKSKLVPVCGSSKSSRNTAKYFDHVVYVEIRNKKHVAGSSTGYSNTAVTGSRTNVELEKSTADKGANLLDIFTNWKQVPKDPEVVVTSSIALLNQSIEILHDRLVPANEPEKLSLKTPLDSSEAIGHTVLSEVQKPVQLVAASTLTPGQIALANLKAKMGGG